ncbi:MAG: glycosyltransferase [Planctomycetota bacterium]
MRVAVAIMAHNEEPNIGALLARVLSAELDPDRLTEVTVVSSGSTDRTDEIVASCARRDARVRLITEAARHGKINAINLFLRRHAPADIVLLMSGDILPAPDALARLLAPFRDPSIGMVGGRPVPANDPKTFLGFTAHLIWEVHHRIASGRPKLGEVVAFRDVVAALPPELAVDEAALEALITQRGLRLHYVPDAIIHNRGPERLGEFLSQRRRITAGHLHLRRRLGYRVSTESPFTGLSVFPFDRIRSPRDLLFAAGAGGIIFLGRLLGWYDYAIRRKTHQVWEIARSTKAVTPQDPRRP